MSNESSEHPVSAHDAIFASARAATATAGPPRGFGRVTMDAAQPARSVFDTPFETSSQVDLSDARVMDLRAIDDEDSNAPYTDETPDGADHDMVQEARPRPVGPGWGAMVAALGWSGAVVGTPLGLLGPDVMIAMEPMNLAALGAIAIAPSAVILACSSAAREAYRARLEQHRMTRLAKRLLQGQDEGTGRAQRHGVSIRTEIAEVNEAITEALDRMAQLEASAIRNAHAFEDAISGARNGAVALNSALNSERDAFGALNADIQAQTENLGAVVARQIRMMREASNLVRQETARADQSLTANIASLATSTVALGEKTEALSSVTKAAEAGAERFHDSLGVALETLGETTKLNDAARKAAESSAITAQAAAQAVRDASVRAATDARRVTEMIRAETKAMQEQAAATLETLRAAAEEARRAAETSEAEAHRFATAREAQAQAQTLANTYRQRAATFGQRRPANDIHPVATPPVVTLREEAVRLVEESGVDLENVFTTADLDYVAGRSKDGPTARRRAVSLAAMEAVDRIGQRLALDGRARETATAFRSKPEIAANDRGRSALKAYLLLDAALG